MTWHDYRGVTIARIFGALQIFPTTRNLVPRFKGSGRGRILVSGGGNFWFRDFNESSGACCPLSLMSSFLRIGAP